MLVQSCSATFFVLFFTVRKPVQSTLDTSVDFCYNAFTDNKTERSVMCEVQHEDIERRYS